MGTLVQACTKDLSGEPEDQFLVKEAPLKPSPAVPGFRAGMQSCLVMRDSHPLERIGNTMGHLGAYSCSLCL